MIYGAANVKWKGGERKGRDRRREKEGEAIRWKEQVSRKEKGGGERKCGF